MARLHTFFIMTVAAFGLSLMSAGAAYAYANPDNNGNASSAPGQAKAVQNCIDTINKQNNNGQTGSNTGSENDSKQLPTAVTNCDHFWQ